MLLQVPNRNCEYYLGDRCWRQLTGTVGIPLDPPLSMLPHLSPTDLQEMRQASFIDREQFVIGEERENYASYWAGQTEEVGHLLTDSQRMGNMDLFGSTILRAESTRDAQRIQELTDKNATLRRYIDSVDEQLYSHNLHLRRGRDVRVVPLPLRGGARMRQGNRGPAAKVRSASTIYGEQVEELSNKNPSEANIGIARPVQEAMWLISVSTASHRGNSSTSPRFNWDQIGKCSSNPEIQNNVKMKLTVDELESIVRIKQAEAKMFQTRADDTRREV
ncbi:hypothetical protein GIB67_002098 [Kingdonia uniflora]|uniref:Oberon coiled-coil region domain-containing protein n=1 Tax=Kingdonia uniflora TaxID=39325 RepID=A0A7J7KWI1_9MAGN|nr:hypothetical protein GIB67_002098 [Kingdonia uniflora]